jgi:hypothetical protein
MMQETKAKWDWRSLAGLIMDQRMGFLLRVSLVLAGCTVLWISESSSQLREVIGGV